MLLFDGVRNRFLARLGLLYKWLYYPFKDSIIARKGYCLKCGSCCSGCRLFDERTRLCKDRELSMVMGCIKYPINRFDQIRLGVEGKCGYYWRKNGKYN